MKAGHIMILLAIGMIVSAKESFAQDIVSNDTTKTLDEVVITADSRLIGKNMKTFVPSTHEKKASASGYDLLSRMALPVLRIAMGSENVETIDGKSVALFIDSTAASRDEIRMLRPQDVLKVQYMDYPSDARFNGAAHVVNFIMRRREFGGYVKTMAKENFIINDGSLQANLRFNQKRMTYDVMGYGSYLRRTISGGQTAERFAASEGTPLLRNSITDKNKTSAWDGQAAFRAKYTSPSFTTNNTLSAGTNNSGKRDISGNISYSDNRYPASEFHSQTDDRGNFFGIDGSSFIRLSTKNSLNISYSGKLSWTHSTSNYDEKESSDIHNSASDRTQEVSITVNNSNNFGKAGNLGIRGYWAYEHNDTDYGGSCDTDNKSEISFGMLGASYSNTLGDFYLYGSFGWVMLRTRLDDKSTFISFPYADLSIQKRLGQKHSLSLDAHYSVWPPSANNKSDNIIHTSPLMWITGNPMLKSYHMLDAGLRYLFFPTRNYTLSLFTYTTLSGDKPRTVYEQYKDGVIRTFKQPDGTTAKYTLGITASTSQFDRRLNISCSAQERIIADKEAFGHTRTNFSYSLQANYYAGDFNFGAYFASSRCAPDYTRSGEWITNKSTYIISAGWSAYGFNIDLSLHNIGRWNWRTGNSRLSDAIYSRNSINTGADSHAAIKVSLVYTIGFGKKIKSSDELGKQYGQSSGILQ